MLNLDEPKFCSHCGHPLDPGDMFCSNCGHPVGMTSTQSQRTNTAYDPNIKEFLLGQPHSTYLIIFFSIAIIIFSWAKETYYPLPYFVAYTFGKSLIMFMGGILLAFSLKRFKITKSPHIFLWVLGCMAFTSRFTGENDAYHSGTAGIVKFQLVLLLAGIIFFLISRFYKRDKNN